VTESYRPMPLVRIPEPFDHREWLYEIKHDGFGAVAIRDVTRQFQIRRGKLEQRR